MRLKRPILFAAGGVLVLLLALVSLGTDRYAPKVAALISSSAQANGIIADIAQPSLTLRSFSAERIALFFPRALLPLSLEKSNLTLSWLSLIRFSPQLYLNSKLYDGEIHAVIGELSNQAPKLDTVLIRGVKLGEHPWVQSFGISADLNGSASALRFAPIAGALPSTGELSISLDPIEKPEKSVLNLSALNFPFPVPIPPINAGKVNIEAVFSADTVEIRNFIFHSQLGDISGHGTVRMGTKPRKVDLDLDIQGSLTDSGSEHLGSYLLLLSPKFTSQTRKFSLKVSGDVRYPKISGEPR